MIDDVSGLSPQAVSAILERIPGARERAEQGRREIDAGHGINLDDFVSGDKGMGTLPSA
jgi:hypothetical protein